MIRMFSGTSVCRVGLNQKALTKLLSTTIMPEMPPCDHKPGTYEGPDYTKVQSIKKQNIVPCILSYYKKPLLLHEGHMQWLFDHTGKRYLDML
ncbi:Hypothetical predicted protein [Cloeon dipterum]|uniref:Uncharacterized protein n=1 Tax=Cloeon dipterum TaxID=197152 RepID=A0A8S1DCQ3_9INSE|nr:Hypothetical predicted protein [Cloeon dipterum]